jgi:triacylglycerol esterase/lipase EstA (alpha/beta hydrolase family)
MRIRKKCAALTLVFVILSALFVGCDENADTPAGRTKANVPPLRYPFIFVHGLNGYGDDRSLETSYWGHEAGQLLPFFESQGYTSYAPSISPAGSAWHRACELYARITGTRVDYGAAHSEEYGHSRYGESYETPLVANWGEKDEFGRTHKIHLISHSFGGAAVRLMISLLAGGDAAERTAATDASPLFAGGKGDWVCSATTIASPHNGVSLLTFAQENPLVQKAAGLLGDPGIAQMIGSLLNMGGIQLNAGSITKILADAVTPDTAYYDLGIIGAAALNKRCATVPGVYYFSYAVDGTKPGAGGYRVATSEMSSATAISAGIIGSFSGETVGNVTIDETWLANDGLVNTVSAQYPFGQPHDALAAVTAIPTATPGTWHVMPTVRGDHGTLVGLGKDSAYLHQFYLPLLQNLEVLQ